jgi:hypothetical protein|uniref:hypothetical protein n=1 Tax=unclassified Variovorax TaxID=663243 RepID=UPI000D3AA2AD
MKNIARLASALLVLVAGQAVARDCYIHAEVSSTSSNARIVMDVLQVDIPYFSPDELKVVLNKPEEDNLKARALAYAKRNLNRAETRVDPAAVLDKVSLTYGGTCYRDARHAEEMRAIGLERSAALHGAWTSEKLPIAPAGATPAAKSGTGSVGNAALLTRTPDTRKPTPEEIAAQKKRDDAFKKSKDDAAAAAKAKAAQDAAAAKARDDKQRQVCMKPEHRGDCGCLRFFPPDPTRKACSK